MGFTNVVGIDTVVDAPPLISEPLSLLDLARTLIDDQGDVASIRETEERAASAQAQAAELRQRVGATVDAADLLAAQRALEDAESRQGLLDAWLSDASKRRATIERWEHGLQYLPELGLSATEVFAPDSVIVEDNLDPADTNLKAAGSNQSPFAWYDPFEVEARDERSLFGWPFTDFASRAARAARGGAAHEAWQCEREFWAGAKIPTNYHLSASPATPTSSPHRTIDAWPDPTPAPGTILGTPVGLAQALQSLDQAIADADAGTGMIHATPYIVQAWMRVFPFIRESGRVYTVNMNLIVPGGGYPGTGPDTAARAVTDLHVTINTTGATSASAVFTFRDIGAPVVAAGLPAGTYISSVTNATTVVLSRPATATHAGEDATIGGPGGRATGNGLQWAYATDQVYKCRGDVQTYPSSEDQASPTVPVDNTVPVRTERPWAFLTNRQLRAAVLVDSTTT